MSDCREIGEADALGEVRSGTKLLGFGEPEFCRLVLVVAKEEFALGVKDLSTHDPVDPVQALGGNAHPELVLEKHQIRDRAFLLLRRRADRRLRRRYVLAVPVDLGRADNQPEYDGDREKGGDERLKNLSANESLNHGAVSWVAYGS